MALDLWTNTGLSKLASGIDASQTTLTVTTGTGSRFPSANFQLVIWVDDFANPIDASDREIVRCTSRSGDVLTIVRGQEGTTGVAHNTGGKTYSVALAVTKRFRDSIFQSINSVIFTAGGTYTKPSNLIAVRVIVIGGGGAGGGVPTDAGRRTGGGGGSGSYSESLILAAAIGATETVTVGAGGTGVSGGAGNNGADSSFGTLVVGKGGTGGALGTVGVNVLGGPGGVAGTGNYKIQGSPGGTAMVSEGMAGFGAPSAIGGGARTLIANPHSGEASPANSGGGGSGAFRDDGGGSTNPGGSGGSGIVIVQEYLNEL